MCACDRISIVVGQIYRTIIVQFRLEITINSEGEFEPSACRVTGPNTYPVFSLLLERQKRRHFCCCRRNRVVVCAQASKKKKKKNRYSGLPSPRIDRVTASQISIRIFELISIQHHGSLDNCVCIAGRCCLINQTQFARKR